MQHTALSGSDTTRRAGYRGQLFGGEFSLFHFRTECHSTQPRSCSILHNVARSVLSGQMNFGHRLSGKKSRRQRPQEGRAGDSSHRNRQERCNHEADSSRIVLGTVARTHANIQPCPTAALNRAHPKGMPLPSRHRRSSQENHIGSGDASVLVARSSVGSCTKNLHNPTAFPKPR
jgi:hypothetical protein